MARKPVVSAAELRRAFEGEDGRRIPQILSPRQLADLLGVSVKTIYAWLAAGRLDGAFRKRGKHILVWRESALDLLFNGPDWKRPNA